MTLEAIATILGPTWQRDLRTGVVVSVVEMTDCYPVSEAPYDPLDRMLGNFADGRFAWHMVNARFLAEPLDLKGRQGLWNVPREAAQEIMRRIGP